MDIIKSLKKYNIPVILYLPSNPPVSNKLVSEKFRYTYGKDSATSQYNQPILENMIREWSLRYGTDVKGWWFDGLYSWNNIKSTRMDMSLKHNISTHTLAAKAGNKNSIVTYNYGFGKVQVNTPYCDYSSGEKMTIDEYPSSRWVEPGVQWFLFTYLGEKWGGHGSQFKTEDLVEKAKQIVKNEGVLCLEVVVTPKGEILPHHLEQIKAVGKGLGKTRY
ncbi:MAG: alpha-L-fucosidase [Bacteroidetes bacterium]|nr:alpha-L-fucosidase [Bacteroidota bacterium]